jgi:catechol 2,3-dioxygenase-like lactoylglutathione lyase family enzyme
VSGPLGGAELVAFAPSTDLARSRAFYEDVLGLTLVEDSSFAVAFDIGDSQLRVTAVEQRVAAPYTVLGWAVADIAAAIDALTARGVVFNRYDGMEQDARGVWRSPSGARVAWFQDPDGNVLSLTQHGG